MNTLDLRAVRRSLGWTQKQAAEHLCVSQALVSMVESRQRALTTAMLERLASYYHVDPSYLPLRKPVTMTRSDYAREMVNLGYPGFAHRKDNKEKPSWNPAQLAVMALSANTLDRRVAEAFPWLVLRYWDADWNWALQQLKVQDLQNRLGFVVTLARELADEKGLGSLENLQQFESQVERSRLVRQDTFCNERMTQAERKWLQTQASPQARHWNLLCDLRPEHLTHVSWECPGALEFVHS
jgi:transcriptional regulator with XRE-family HTH domain